MCGEWTTPCQMHKPPPTVGQSTLRVGTLPGSSGQGGAMVVGGGRRRGLLFLGHLSPAFCSGALPRAILPVLSGSVKLRPAPRGLWSTSWTFGALCLWTPRTQNMADGAQVNPKGFKKKVLVRHPVGWRGPSLRASSPLRTSRYVPAPLGWNHLWRGAEMGLGNCLLKPISLARRALCL